jgi:hypothetical protein
MAKILLSENLPAKVTRWKDLVAKYFRAEQVLNALNVINIESGGDTEAVGDRFPIRGILAPSIGLFQIRSLKGRDKAAGFSNVADFIKALKGPEYNIKYAANLWNSSGWKPWSSGKKLGLVK